MTAETQSQQQGPGENLAARLVALHLLEDVLQRKRALDQALASSHDFAQLPQRDRGFVRMLVTTTLRRCGQVDDLIMRAMDRKEPASPPSLHNVLRLGATQIAFMDVPDYAVVNTGVEMAVRAGLSRQKGLVNAVLRRIAGEDGRTWLGKQDAARLNVPGWLMQVWIADYGLREAAEIAQASLSEAPLDMTLKDEDESGHWAQTLEGAWLPTGSLRRKAGGAVTDLPGFADGMWWVQDAAAALPARLLGDIEGKLVVDMCAAPGGKTMQLAAQGAHVVALDRSVQRLRVLEENLKRTRLDDVMVEAADGTVWKPKNAPDFILLDAPCTATGTIRRHPDVLHLKTPNDMQRMMDVQAKLLENAVDVLKPGGVLLYCTCSLQKDESERQVEHILAARDDLKRLPITSAEVGGVEKIVTPEGDVRILPYHLAAHGGMDGFYIARLIKE